jgi:hypothetical protein
MNTEQNIFATKEVMPDEAMIKEALGGNYTHFKNLRQIVRDEIGETTGEWDQQPPDG